MTNANKKRKRRGDPLKYKDLTNINWNVIDFAVTEDNKKFYDYCGPIKKTSINQFKKYFMDNIKNQIKKGLENISHYGAVNSALCHTIIYRV